MTFTSLLIALIASLFAMQTLSHPRPAACTSICWRRYGWGLGIALMHYVGMSAMRSQAQAYFESGLFLASVGHRHRRQPGGAAAVELPAQRHRGISSIAQIRAPAWCWARASSACTLPAWRRRDLIVPTGDDLSLPLDNNPIQLGLSVAVITLLVIGSSISAALADKKLQHKERDLRRVNALLSELDQARASLQQVAHYDALTSLLNRRGFNQIFAEKVAEKTASNGMMAVIFLDIDHFKRINDSLGHDAGDRIAHASSPAISKARCAAMKTWSPGLAAMSSAS